MTQAEAPTRQSEAAPTTLTRADKLGLPPGSLVHVGERRTDAVTVRVHRYGVERWEELKLDATENLGPLLAGQDKLWIDVCGVHDVAVIAGLGEVLGLHSLVMEDILNTHQRPKVEIFDDYVFAVVKMVRHLGEEEGLDVEQVSLVLGPHWVVTFQERAGDVFDAVRTRLQLGVGRIRKAGSDYLLYALLDVVVDHYFLVEEELSERGEGLEQEIFGTPAQGVLEAIHALRREATVVRHAAWPLREAVQTLLREETELVTAGTEPYLRDLYDHVVQVIDTVETQREALGGYVDLYLSSVSNRMNEVMRVLTVIATIFIPLTFVAGIYGMNFDYMPELGWRWGYFGVWGVMGGLAGGMLLFFRRRGWF